MHVPIFYGRRCPVPVKPVTPCYSKRDGCVNKALKDIKNSSNQPWSRNYLVISMPRSYWGYWFHPVITWPFVDFVQVNVICHFSLVLTPMISRSKVYIRFNDNVIISCDIGSTPQQFQEQWNINDQIIRQQQKSWWWKGWFLRRSMMPTGNKYWTYSDLFNSSCEEMQSFSNTVDRNILKHVPNGWQKYH